MGQSDDVLSIETMLTDPCFNELSVFPLCTNEEEMRMRIETFVSLLRKLRKYGFAKLRCEHGLSDFKLTKAMSLFEYCQSAFAKDNQNKKDRDNANFLFTFIRKPYLKDNEESNFGDYDEVKCCLDERNNTWCDCYGLYIAHILKSFAVSFDVSITNPCKLKLTKNKIVNTNIVVESEQIVNIANISNLGQLENDMFTIRTLSEKEINVPKAGSNKALSFTLPSHHGVKECMQHGEQLLQSPYVVDILNSIPFDPSEKQYIHNVYPNGIIEVRLHWTKVGYGLKIATSAQDIIEAWWVAKNLQNYFG